MLDIGNTHPETLYDFATTLDATNWTCSTPIQSFTRLFGKSMIPNGDNSPN